MSFRTWKVCCVAGKCNCVTACGFGMQLGTRIGGGRGGAGRVHRDTNSDKCVPGEHSKHRQFPSRASRHDPLGAHRPFYAMATGGLSPDVQRPGRAVDRSLPSIAAVKNAWRCASTVTPSQRMQLPVCGLCAAC